ncbi:MAG: hypothetical protein PHT33_08985 [bacterium]|nr:hypothetical protein [bacterium]
MERDFEWAFNNSAVLAPVARCLDSLTAFRSAIFTSIGRTFAIINPLYYFRLLPHAVPGLVQIYGHDRDSRGWLILFGFLALLAGTLYIYGTPFFIPLIWLVLGLSIASASAAASPPSPEGGAMLNRRRIGHALILLYLYLCIYLAAWYIFQRTHMICNINRDAWTGRLSSGDTLLLNRKAPLHRGDIIAGNWRYWENAGEIIGIPGDRITVGSRIRLNGRIVSDVIMPGADEAGRSASIVLGENDYWILVRAENGPPPPEDNRYQSYLDIMVRDGIIARENVWGRVTAVLGPPSHRRILRGR